VKTIPGSGRHHHVVRFGIFLIAATLIAGAAGCRSIPIGIEDWHDLDAIRNNMRGSYQLMNDLDSTTAGYEELASPTANDGKGWQPIGSIAVNRAFVGSLDGQGHEIRDLCINRPEESDVGLFGVVEAGVVIGNIGVGDGNVSGYGNVGSLVGYNRGTVRNAYAGGNVTGHVNVGSLVGVNDGTVSTCYCSGNVTGTYCVGDLVGRNDGTVSNSYSIGMVTGNDLVGSLVGVNDGTMSNSCAGGPVMGNDFVGGLAGRNEGTVSKCYSMGSVTGDEYTGGLVGQNLYGVVSDSVWDTQTSGQATSDGGTGKTTAEMKNIATFSGAGWDIITVVDSSTRNIGYIWNIVDAITCPFLSWQPA
jgi:hypothetical protein